MASLNDALKSALDGWNSDDTHVAPTYTETTYKTVPMNTPTTSVSESTFNFIKSNPNVSKKYAVGALTQLGFNPSSTTSLISGMIRQGLVNRSHTGHLTARVPKYVPLKVMSKPKSKRDQVRIIVKGEDINGIAALAGKPPVASSIANLLDNISVNEARALYLELKTMFGGN
jgi:hypothetical protein